MNIKKIKKQDDDNVIVIVEKVETEERSLSNEQLIDQLRVLETQYENNVDEMKAIEDKNEEISYNIDMIKDFIGVKEDTQELQEEQEEEYQEE